MHISFGLSWFYGDKDQKAIEEALLRLLEAIKDKGSLKRACEETHLSYRHAWGLLKKWESEFDSPLVTLQRGRNHGANLTPLGAKLLNAHQILSDRFYIISPFGTPTDDTATVILKNPETRIADWFGDEDHRFRV